MPDLAVVPIGIVIDALADVFDPAGPEPPEHGSTVVHFFAGEGPATAAFTAHTDSPGCEEPFLWVRVARRYRTHGIPEIAIEQQPCALPRAIEVEVGVARCAVTDLEPSLEDYDAEGELSLEDSWRIEGVLCVAAKRLTDAEYAVVTEEVLPHGPLGGIIGWSGAIHIQYQ